MNNLAFGKGLMPIHDVVFTSIDTSGNAGRLNQYVIEKSGLNVALPSAEQLEDGYCVVEQHGRFMVFVVTLDLYGPTGPALSKNFLKAIEHIKTQISSGASFWVPLMGTGSARLSMTESAQIIGAVLQEQLEEHEGFINVSLPLDCTVQQEDELKPFFGLEVIPEPPLPEEQLELVNQFLERFPLERLDKLTLEEYTNVKTQQYFTYWLEHATSKLGGVRGGSSFKFGIFRRRDKTKKSDRRGFSYSDNYAWYTNFGQTEDIAFERVKAQVVRLANSARAGNLQGISETPFDSRIKWKIAFLYQDFSRPTSTSIYKKEALLALSGLSKSQFSYANAHKLLVAQKPQDQDIWSFSRDLWWQWLEMHPEDIKDEKANENEIVDETDESEQEMEADEFVFEVAGFRNDSVKEIDAFNIEPEVEALASIIAYTKTDPPMSIGVFGEWGTGKSFYMRTLKDKVEELARLARQSGRPQREFPFYKKIVSVEFNAWQYAESNLLASLAQHVYRQLYEWTEHHDDSKAYWLALLKYGETALAEKKLGVAKLEQKHDACLREVEALRAMSSRNDIVRPTEQTVLNEKLSEDTKKELEKLIKELGGEATVNSMREGMSAVADIKALGLGVKSILKPPAKGTLLLLLGIAVAVGAGVSQIPDSDNWLPQVSGLAAAFALVRDKLNQVANWTSSINRLRAAIVKEEGAKQAEFDEYFKDEQKKRAEQHHLLVNKQREAAELERQLEIKKSDIETLTPEHVLSSHVGEIVGEKRYDQHLGLPAQISEDFNKLSQIIDQVNQQLLNVNSRLTLAEEDAKDFSYRINRIVLYIDDLDRCPPETVMKVLDAIHLFLAKPLFVVVLAVDPRILFGAIRSRYKNIMKGNEFIQGVGRYSSTPEEYLEKILQLPIWLKRPGYSDVEKLMANITGGKVPSRISPFGASSRKEKEVGSTTLINTANPGASETRASELSSDYESRVLFTAQLHSLDDERDFAISLSPLMVRSPRATKYSLNLFRLIKATRTEALKSHWLATGNEENDGYKHVLFILAIVIGWPSIAPKLLIELRKSSAKTSITGQMIALRGFLKPSGENNTPKHENQFEEHEYEMFEKFTSHLSEVTDFDLHVSSHEGMYIDTVARYSLIGLNSDFTFE